MKYALLLLFTFGLLSEQLAAATFEERVMPIVSKGSDESSTNQGQLLAAKKKKKKSTKKKKDKKKTSEDETLAEEGTTEGDTSSGGSAGKIGAKGVVGMVMGSKSVEIVAESGEAATESLSGTVLTFGADVIYAVSQPITVEAGFTMWSNSTSGGTYCDVATAAQSVEGGGVYHLGLTKTIFLDAGGRLGFAMYKSSIDCDAPFPEGGSLSGSAPFLDIQIGGSLHFGNFSVGPEIRKPLYFSTKFKGFSLIYALLAAKLMF